MGLERHALLQLPQKQTTTTYYHSYMGFHTRSKEALHWLIKYFRQIKFLGLHSCILVGVRIQQPIFFILGQPYDFIFVFDSTFVVPTVRYHQGDSQPNFKFLIYFKTRQLERSFEIPLGCYYCHPSSLTHCQMRLGFA